MRHLHARLETGWWLITPSRGCQNDDVRAQTPCDPGLITEKVSNLRHLVATGVPSKTYSLLLLFRETSLSSKSAWYSRCRWSDWRWTHIHQSWPDIVSNFVLTTSIYPFSVTAHPTFAVTGVLEPIPVRRVKAGYTPDKSPVHCRVNTES